MKKLAKIGFFTDWYCPVEIRKECPFLSLPDPSSGTCTYQTYMPYPQNAFLVPDL